MQCHGCSLHIHPDRLDGARLRLCLMTTGAAHGLASASRGGSIVEDQDTAVSLCAPTHAPYAHGVWGMRGQRTNTARGCPAGGISAAEPVAAVGSEWSRRGRGSSRHGRIGLAGIDNISICHGDRGVQSAQVAQASEEQTGWERASCYPRRRWGPARVLKPRARAP